MTRFYLVRHGETEWNRLHRIQGSSDIPLNETGRAQALRVGGILARHRFDLIVSSPLSRAFETASIIAGRLSMPVPLVIPALVERHYGQAEGATREDLDRLYPGDTPIPGREERSAVNTRVVSALRELAIGHPSADIVVVSHGGVIRSVVEHAAPGRHPEPIRNCSVHSFEYTAHGVQLISFDDPMESMARRIAREDFTDQNPSEQREQAG